MNRNTGRLSSLATLLVLAVTGSLAGQGGIIWPGVTPAPYAVIIQRSSVRFDVLFSGFATFPSPLLDGNDDVGAGIGIEPGGVRTVDEVVVVDEGDGAAMASSVVFPFRHDTKVTAQFDALTPSPYQWHGFKSTPTASVPSFRSATLKFKLRASSPITRAVFERQIRNSFVGIGSLDANGNLRNNARRFLLKTAAIFHANSLYYKFERPLGDIALNYVTRFAGAPMHGDLLASSTTLPLVSGQFGLALRGGDATEHFRCDTRWRGGVRGNMTFSWFMRQRNAPKTTQSHFFGVSGGVQCFTNGQAGSGLRITGWGNNVAPIHLNHDLQKDATSAWIHVAVVLDDDADVARWYLNGVAKPTVPMTGVPDLPLLANGLLIGGSSGAANFYDIDEFRFAPFKVPASHIRIQATQPTPGVGSYGDPSGCLLTSKGGTPRLGNNKFEVWVLGSPDSKLALVLGGTVKPWSLANGSWNVDVPALAVVFGSNSNSVRFRQQLPIPNNIALRGVTVQAQAYMSTKNGNDLVSNALAISIE